MPTILQSLGTALKWLGASVAALTAALYALGFLSIGAHLRLLGISALVDVSATEYLIEGARLLVQMPVFALGAAALCLPVAVPVFLLRGRLQSRPHALLGLAIFASAVSLVLWLGFLQPAPGILLRWHGATLQGGTLIDKHIARGDAGRPFLMGAFALFLGVAALAFQFAWSWFLAKHRLTAAASWTTVGEPVLFLLLVVLAILVPVGYGALCYPLRYPYVRLEPGKDARFVSIEGWLLNRRVSKDNVFVLYVAVERKLRVLPPDSFDSVTVLHESHLLQENPK